MMSFSLKLLRQTGHSNVFLPWSRLHPSNPQAIKINYVVRRWKIEARVLIHGVFQLRRCFSKFHRPSPQFSSDWQYELILSIGRTYYLE